MITLELQTRIEDGTLFDQLMAYCRHLSSSAVYLADTGCSVWPWVEGAQRISQRDTLLNPRRVRDLADDAVELDENGEVKW